MINIICIGQPHKNAKKVWFEDKKGVGCTKVLKYDGVPYIILGRKVFQCQHIHDDDQLAYKSDEMVSINKIL